MKTFLLQLAIALILDNFIIQNAFVFTEPLPNKHPWKTASFVLY